MKRKTLRLFCSLLACTLLTGCASKSASPAPGVTLPPVVSAHTAPENDESQQYTQTVLLYLPSLDGTRLIALPRSVTLSASRRPAETLLSLLFAQSETEETTPLGGDVTLRLSELHPVEISGDVATVSLGASALRLSREAFFTVGQAIANTLCQFGDLRYVNVLIADAQPGLDVAGTLPAGCFRFNEREDLTTLWSRAAASSSTRRTIAAALYYPAAEGKGVLCEGRLLSFGDLSPAGLMTTLLEALSTRAETLSCTPAMPDLINQLAQAPTLNEANGQRIMVLRFQDALNGILLSGGITRSVMVASLVCTAHTFIPGLDGVEIWIGSEQLTSLTPLSTYNGAGETMRFDRGLMKRGDFSDFLLSCCTLYFANADGELVAVKRPIPFYSAGNPRAVINELMRGPQPYDSPSGLLPVLPDGLQDADLIGVSLDQSAMVLNFSDQLLRLCQDMPPQRERSLIYAVVNTLCRLPGVKRVSFFVMGQQPETLAGAVFLPGDFLPRPDDSD